MMSLCMSLRVMTSRLFGPTVNVTPRKINCARTVQYLETPLGHNPENFFCITVN